MDSSFIRFVWRNSRRDQLIILALTFLSFPLVYLSLEIPKIIVNDAIDGRDFPRVVLGFEFDQVPYLLLLCFAFLGMVVLINGVKWVLWIAVGMCGERMLRRMRFLLFEQVLRYRISRFRTTKPGEVIQAMLAEVEPLGGFIGEVISTPAFQGGLLCVYMLFIFMQDVWLGLAAISLYPIQAVIIPLLQKKVIRLNRARARNNRVLADTIGESIGNIPEIFTNDTPRWHLAQLTYRLHTNTMIRLQLFRRKFTIKFINNFLNQLTPFFFYSIGGYLVIVGRLDFGSLVAVLAAYKDLAGPWREVLNYIQRWTDFNSRYEYVVETFTGDGVHPPERIYGERPDPLTGDFELSGVEGGPGSGGLTVNRLVIRPAQSAAVFGGGNGSRDALLRLMVGLMEPAEGRVAIGGRPLVELTLRELGATVAYVGAEPGILARPIRDNLVYGLLRRAPDLADKQTAEAMTLLREARKTGNLTADPEGDWIDYDAAGVAGPEQLDTRLLKLVERVGLADDLVSGALDSRVPPDRAGRWTDPILKARAELRASLGEAGLADVAEPWQPGRFNTNADLLENLLFGMLVDPPSDPRELARTEPVAETLDAIGVRGELEAIGRDIAEEFATLVETVGETSSVLDGFPAYPKADILTVAELVESYRGKPLSQIRKEQRESLLVLALAFVETRDRLDVLDEGRKARLMEAQAKARRHLAGPEGRPRDDFVFFDEDRFNPGRPVAENILNAKRRHDRKAAWRTLTNRMEGAIRAAGLRQELVRLGLDAPAGSGGSNLSATARRRVALVRALLKRPSVLVLDGVAAGNGESDRGLRALVREELPGAIFVFAADDASIDDADLRVEIDSGGTVKYDSMRGPDEDGRADGTTGRTGS